MPDLSIFAQQSFNGLVISGIYILVALGITLAFGLTGIANFAHGHFMLLGGYFALEAIRHGAPALPAVVIAIVGVALFSFATERGVFRFTLSNPTSGFVASLGLSVAMESAIVRRWGLDIAALTPWRRGVWTVLGVHVAQQRIIVLLTTTAMVGALFALLRYSALGRAMRACAEDRATATIMGLNVGRTIALTFAIGGALAAVAGVLLGTLFPFTPFTGAAFVLKGFAISLIGGLGSVLGVVIGGLLLGMGETYAAAYWNPAYSDMFAFVIMIAVILWRPAGFFASVERRF